MPKMQLSVEQRYLLQRIPNRYQLDKQLKEEEPLVIKKARRVVEKYDAAKAKRQKAYEDRIDKLAEAAREAIYFKSLEAALQLVRKVEIFVR